MRNVQSTISCHVIKKETILVFLCANNISVLCIYLCMCVIYGSGKALTSDSWSPTHRKINPILFILVFFKQHLLKYIKIKMYDLLCDIITNRKDALECETCTRTIFSCNYKGYIQTEGVYGITIWAGSCKSNYNWIGTDYCTSLERKESYDFMPLLLTIPWPGHQMILGYLNDHIWFIWQLLL